MKIRFLAILVLNSIFLSISIPTWPGSSIQRCSSICPQDCCELSSDALSLALSWSWALHYWSLRVILILPARRLQIRKPKHGSRCYSRSPHGLPNNLNQNLRMRSMQQTSITYAMQYESSQNRHEGWAHSGFRLSTFLFSACTELAMTWSWSSRKIGLKGYRIMSAVGSNGSC